MLSRLLPLISILCISITVKAQFQIQGKIISDKGSPLSNVTIALLRASDSQLVKTDLSNDKGAYLFPAIEKGEYFIQISKLGYDRKRIEKFILDKNTTLNLTLQESAKKLKEVSVVATKPLLEQRADKLIVNVANSPIAAGGTAQEILKKVPGVIVVQDKVTLAGSGDVQIWIDGKPSVYQDINAVLRNMPGDQIEKIELIRQPGAKYDAAGGPIINIVLKKNARLGLNGTAQLSLMGFQVNHADVNQGIKEYGRANPSLSLNYRSGSWNLFGGASYSRGSGFQAIQIARFIENTTFRSPSLIESNNEALNLRIGADYFLNKKTTLGVLFKGFKTNNQRFNNNLTNVFDAPSQAMTNSFFTNTNSNSDNQNLSANFNLKHLFDTTKDHSLNFDFDYARYELTMRDDIEIFQNNAPLVKSNSTQQINQPVQLVVAKLDYTLPLDSTMRLEMGAKTSFAQIDNDLRFYRGSTLSANESNQFLYKENISAAYTNFHKSWKKLEFNVGLRTENTIATGTTGTAELLNRNYLQWFPNASLLYKLNKQMGVQLAYTKRVNRPSFNQQNPFRRFIDSLTYQSGNPNLFPEVAHNGQLAIVYEGQPFISVEYNVTDDVIIDNAPKLEGNTTFTTADNLAKKYNWTLQANFPIKFGKIIDGYGGNQLIYNHYKAQYLGSTYDASRWHWLAYVGITAKLPKDYALEFNGFYITKFLEEFITINAMSGFDLAVSKTFWEKRGRLTLNFSDIFYGQKVNGLIEFNNIRAEFIQREFSQNLRLTFSYNFGNNKLLKQRNRKTGAEDENSRVKTEK
ncbi:MAG: TonB-dependent receptor [Chitinophagales bacterium]|nr:TonB-dependent receptor [Chitinophagales bacterium]